GPALPAARHRDPAGVRGRDDQAEDAAPGAYPADAGRAAAEPRAGAGRQRGLGAARSLPLRDPELVDRLGDPALPDAVRLGEVGAARRVGDRGGGGDRARVDRLHARRHRRWLVDADLLDRRAARAYRLLGRRRGAAMDALLGPAA